MRERVQVRRLHGGLRGLADARGQLTASSAMHVVNDALFSGMYPLLPLVAAELGLSYAQVGAVKTAFSGASSVLQIPAGLLAERVGEQLLLSLGTGWVALGLLTMAFSPGYLTLLTLAVMAGIGGNVQHPVASAIVSRVYDGGRRATAIGTLNFAGDVGKVIAPLIVGFTAASYGWRGAFAALGALGAIFAAVYVFVVPEPRTDSASGNAPPSGNKSLTAERSTGAASSEGDAVNVPNATLPAEGDVPPAPNVGWGINARGAFGALLGIGMLDSAARGTALVFIPFLLADKGADPASMSLYFALLFAAGAAGKFICGPLADRFGSVATIAVTELVTAGALGGLLVAPLAWVPLALVPLGFMLNGTSSVLYASVASLVHASRRARGYGIYYTCSLVASAGSPLLYGVLADRVGLSAALLTLAMVTAGIVPVALTLGSTLRGDTR